MYQRKSNTLLIVLKLVTQLDLALEEGFVAVQLEVEQEDDLYEVLQEVVDPTLVRQHTHLMQKTTNEEACRVTSRSS